MQTNANTHCAIHNEPIVVVDKKKPLAEQNMCAKCLTTQRAQFILPEDVSNQIYQIKQESKYRRENLNQQNSELLKNLLDSINEFINSYVVQFTKITGHIQEWVKRISLQNETYASELDSIETHSLDLFFQKLDSLNKAYNDVNTGYKTLISGQLQHFQLDQINQFEQTIQFIDDQNNVVQYSKQPEQTPKCEGTPKLKLLCEEHKKKIIMIDLNECRAKENRLGCVYCVHNNPSKYTPITIVQEKWEAFQKEKWDKLNNYKSSYQIKVDSLKQTLSNMKNTFIKKIDETQSLLKDNQDSASIKIDDHQHYIDWQTVTKDQVIQIAEILSKQQNFGITDDLKQQEQEIVQVINDSFLKLRETEQDCFKKVCQLFPSNDSQLSIRSLVSQESQTQFENRVQATQTDPIQVQQPLIQQPPQQQFIIIQNANQLSYAGQGNSSAHLQRECFQLIQQNPTTQLEMCWAIAINQTKTIMIASCAAMIKVFDLKQGILSQKQLLTGHVSDVWVLNFMKKTNQFISGSVDSSIRLWEQNANQLYQCISVFKGGHSSYVNCVITNQNEDLLVSCSHDKSIKFWSKKSEWECTQTIVAHTDTVFSIFLNEKSNQLVSSGGDKLILIIQFTNKWAIIQTISVEQFGYRISYIDDKTIAFQSFNGKKMDIFEQNQSGLFIKTKEIAVEQSIGCDWLFPHKFNKQKSILVNKNGLAVNIIKKNNNEFYIEQSIRFPHFYIFGVITDDAELLVTWDVASKTYQVRKYIP